MGPSPIHSSVHSFNSLGKIFFICVFAASIAASIAASGCRFAEKNSS
jgi:hypothetical protein